MLGVSSVESLRGPGDGSELLGSRVGMEAEVGELSDEASSNQGPNSKTVVTGSGW